MGSAVPLLQNLSEFCSSKYWDAFFNARGGHLFECYGDWKLISKLVKEECGLESNMEILIPRCGNSTLSADMYDVGFVHITNIDFSQVVIREMLRQHVRSRPCMRWLVMDMTKMKFSDDSFDVLVDNGGLDALLGEPEDDRSYGVLFLSEVKRVLKPSGRFACISLAQKHVIELLLCTFREGWHLSVHGLQLPAADTPSSLQPFLVIAKLDGKVDLSLVSFDLDLNWRGSSNPIGSSGKDQMQAVVAAVDTENALRSQGRIDSRITKFPEINLDDCYKDLHPGRRLTIKLRRQQPPRFTCAGVILDTKEAIISDYHCAIFLVPKGREYEWLFSSIEGQWQVAESTKAGRLILISLDPNPKIDNILDVKDYLSPLVKCFLPLDSRESVNVPYVTGDDGMAKSNIVTIVDSPMTGTMVVEDVVLANEKPSTSKSGSRMLGAFRQLLFRRNPNLIQSEALLMRSQVLTKNEVKGRSVGESDHKHALRKKKKKATKDLNFLAKPQTFEEPKVDHSYLACPYHEVMITALVLIAKNLEQWLASKQQVRLMLVGLGAGLLPMFLHNHLPIDDIQIIELDPMVGDVAKLHFGFVEDDRMKLHIGDGIVAVQSIAATVSPSSVQHTTPIGKIVKNETSTRGNMAQADLRLHILIVDADSEDPSTGLSCPSPKFLEDSFLLAARAALVVGGLLIINVVSTATSYHVQCVTQLKRLFEEVYYFEVSKDVNRVLIALPQPRNVDDSSDIMKDLSKLEKIGGQFASWGNGPNLKSIVRDLKRLK